MTGLYGYDIPVLGDILDPNKQKISDHKERSRRALAIEPDEDWEDTIPVKPREAVVITPVIPKVKSFNKQLINKELEQVSANFQHLNTQIVIVKDQMSQEDADDVYGVEKVFAELTALAKDWVRIRECLNKELELS